MKYLKKYIILHKVKKNIKLCVIIIKDRKGENMDNNFNDQNKENNLGIQSNQQPMSNSYNVGQTITNPNINNNICQMDCNNLKTIKPKKLNVFFIIIPIVALVAGMVSYFAFFNNKENKLDDDEIQNSGINNETGKMIKQLDGMIIVYL